MMIDDAYMFIHTSKWDPKHLVKTLIDTNTKITQNTNNSNWHENHTIWIGNFDLAGR